MIYASLLNNALDMSLGEDYGNGNLNDIVTKHKLAPSLMAQRRNPNVIGNNFRQQLVIRSEGSVGTDSVGPVDLTGKFPANVPLGGCPRTTVRLRKIWVRSFSALFKLNSKTIRLKKPRKLSQTDFPSELALFSDKLLGKPRLTDLLKCETRHDVRQGTIECDTDGSLIFYAGDGVSKALTASSLNTDFADNSNWYDDICDGQVTAKFTLKNSACEVSINNGEDAAWIATAPVDYAPQIQPLSTLYDMVSGASEDIDSLDTQFSDVFPILYRLYRMQWVNQADFADNSLNEALSIIDFKTLVDNQADAAVKQGVFKRFRNPLYPVGEPTDQIRKDANGEFISNSRLIPSKDSTDIRPTPTPAELLLPYYPGDGIDYPGSPMQWFAIPPFMYKHLENWSKNAFATVTSAESEAAKGGIESLADFYHDIFEASEHKALLSARAALDSLYGGGFHPGVELTWPMRRKQMYLPIGANIPVGEEINLLGLREFRINAATSDDDTFNDFGRVITGENVKSSIKGDPDAKWLWESTPGDLTKWMGIPWQSDAASCQLVYAAQDFPIPAWWAANLPVTVLPAARYEKFKHGFNPRIPQTQESYDALRISQFSARQFWLQTADTGFVGYHAEAGYTNGLIAMVNQWKNMGMVMARPGTVPEPTQPQASSPIPKVVYVSYGVNDKDIAGLK
jgi:hypothetical protein